jgi:alkyl sulfatase BDS1-like metallo-beta-lactamase superfamily hydrolase
MVVTYKDKFNKKYGFEKGEPHSLTEVAKATGYKVSGLKTIFNKGVGAFKTNPASVRPTVKSPEQWAMARVYSAVMGGKAAKVDASHLIKKK